MAVVVRICRQDAIGVYSLLWQVLLCVISIADESIIWQAFHVHSYPPGPPT